MTRFCITLLLGSILGCASKLPVDSLPVSSAEDVVLPDLVVVSFADQRVTVPAFVALDAGWLEVFACVAGTRDHEAALVLNAKPSTIHAALLMLGLEPGSPATYDAKMGIETPPAGPRVAISVEWIIDESTLRSRSAGELLATDRDLPDPIFVFAGSIIAPNAESMGPGEHYVADFTGTVVGLATFGEELIASRAVHSHELGVEPAAWKLKPGMLPEVGSKVTLVLKPIR